MDVNTLRALVTVLSFLCFAGIVVWAWSRRNRAAFDEAAHLPFEHESAPPAATPAQGARR